MSWLWLDLAHLVFAEFETEIFTAAYTSLRTPTETFSRSLYISDMFP